MKLVFEENEKENIRMAEESLRRIKGSGRSLFGDDPDREYSINFKVTDPCIAEYIIGAMLVNSADDISGEIGINVTSINLKPYTNKEDIKSQLHDAIESIVK